MDQRTIYLHRNALDRVRLRGPGTVDGAESIADPIKTEILAGRYRVFNAPRPLLGLEWQGDFRHGVFYAAVSTNDPALIARNEQLDGWPVEFMDDAQIRAAVDRHLDQIEAEYGPGLGEAERAELRTEYWDFYRENLCYPPLEGQGAGVGGRDAL